MSLWSRDGRGHLTQVRNRSAHRLRTWCGVRLHFVFLSLACQILKINSCLIFATAKWVSSRTTKEPYSLALQVHFCRNFTGRERERETQLLTKRRIFLHRLLCPLLPQLSCVLGSIVHRLPSAGRATGPRGSIRTSTTEAPAGRCLCLCGLEGFPPSLHSLLVVSAPGKLSWGQICDAAFVAPVASHLPFLPPRS